MRSYGFFVGVAGLATFGACQSTSNRTISGTDLQTWWHATGEVNTRTAVQPGNVRQSHLYSIQIAAGNDTTFYDSFVYETIPRNGNGNILDPNDPKSTTDQDDGINIESAIGLTMAWTQFLYSTNASIKIHRLDGKAAEPNDVKIRPTTFSVPMAAQGQDLLIQVPYSDSGLRFSVEFASDLYSFRNGDPGPSSGYVQNSDPDGPSYVSSLGDNNPTVGIEPLNSLLVFASAFPDPSLSPSTSEPSALIVQPGLVDAQTLATTSASTVIFNPGVYWFTGTANANLSSSVNWIHLAPGAYVKGAVEFGATTSPSILATGHGVLSGEQYVYQANPAQGWKNTKSDGDSLRMWRGISTPGIHQTFVLNGPTINAPPFNSMDFTGDLDSLSCHVHDYKQIGAFFGQTDGVEMYPGSRVSSVFYHSNDDTLKTYYSNVTVEDVTIWKGHTAPIIQFGWSSRTVRNVLVDQVHVIHARWNRNDSHPSIVGANQQYTIAEDQYNTSNLENTYSNLTFSNIRLEGIGGNLFRIFPLETLRNISLTNINVEQMPVASTSIGQSEMVYNKDANGNPTGVVDWVVKNYQVNGTRITDLGGAGGLNVAPEYHISIE